MAAMSAFEMEGGWIFLGAILIVVLLPIGIEAYIVRRKRRKETIERRLNIKRRDQ